MHLKTPTIDIAPAKLHPYVKSKTQTQMHEFASCFCPYRLSPHDTLCTYGAKQLRLLGFSQRHLFGCRLMCDPNTMDQLRNEKDTGVLRRQSRLRVVSIIVLPGRQNRPRTARTPGLRPESSDDRTTGPLRGPYFKKKSHPFGWLFFLASSTLLDTIHQRHE